LFLWPLRRSYRYELTADVLRWNSRIVGTTSAAYVSLPPPTRIRELRAKHGLSLARLAVKAGVAVSTVQIAERGLLSERVAKRLARALGVAPSELVPGDTGAR
jgi:ribosome-binding protein aMBF1 (putative translation factor)